MALDFPSNPVNGQIYDSYYYDSVMGTWRAQGSGLALNAFVNPTITGGTISGLSTDLAVADGGTGASTLTGYVKGNGASAFTAQTTPIPVSDGGTGASTLTSGAYLKGAGTSAITSQAGIPAGDITSGALGIAYGGTGATTGAGLVLVLPSSLSISAGTASLNSTTGEITWSGGNVISVNGVFTTAYQRYRIVCTMRGGTTGDGLYMRLNEAGSTAWYYYAGIYVRSNGTGVAALSGNGGTLFDIGRMHNSTEFKNHAVIEIYQPMDAGKNTHISYSTLGEDSNPISVTGNGLLSSPTVQSGFHLWASGGSATTGTMKIYGYR